MAMKIPDSLANKVRITEIKHYSHQGFEYLAVKHTVDGQPFVVTQAYGEKNKTTLDHALEMAGEEIVRFASDDELRRKFHSPLPELRQEAIRQIVNG